MVMVHPDAPEEAPVSVAEYDQVVVNLLSRKLMLLITYT